MRTLAKLSWVELKLFIREPLTVVFSLALPLIVLFVLGGVFGNEPSGPGEQVEYRGVGPMNYYVPAYLALVVASVAVISIPTHLAGSRERGVLKRFHASSVSAWSIAGAEVAVATVLSTVSALILMIAARLAYDFATPESVGLAAFVFLVLVVGFAAFGIFLGAVLPTARAAQAVGMLVWFVMLFLGGAGPPPEVLTGAMQRVADLTPLWHGVQMMQQAWLGLDAGASWLVFGVIAAGSAALGLRFFRWEWDAADSRLGGVVELDVDHELVGQVFEHSGDGLDREIGGQVQYRTGGEQRAASHWRAARLRAQFFDADAASGERMRDVMHDAGVVQTDELHREAGGRRRRLAVCCNSRGDVEETFERFEIAHERGELVVGHGDHDDAGELAGQLRHVALVPVAPVIGDDARERIHEAGLIVANCGQYERCHDVSLPIVHKGSALAVHPTCRAGTRASRHDALPPAPQCQSHRQTPRLRPP